MWMVEAFEDLDFAVEVVLELLIQLREVYRLDSYESSRGLGIDILAPQMNQNQMTSREAHREGTRRGIQGNYARLHSYHQHTLCVPL